MYGNVQQELIQDELGLIRHYADDYNFMIFLVGHNIEECQEIADERYHIENGKMQEIDLKEKSKIKGI